MSYSNSYFVKLREDPTDDLLFKGYYLTQQFWELKFGTKFGILQFDCLRNHTFLTSLHYQPHKKNLKISNWESKLLDQKLMLKYIPMYSHGQELFYKV